MGNIMKLTHLCHECGHTEEVDVDVTSRKLTCPCCAVTNDFWLEGETPPPNHRDQRGGDKAITHPDLVRARENLNRVRQAWNDYIRVCTTPEAHQALKIYQDLNSVHLGELDSMGRKAYTDIWYASELYQSGGSGGSHTTTFLVNGYDAYTR